MEPVEGSGDQDSGDAKAAGAHLEDSLDVVEVDLAEVAFDSFDGVADQAA